MKPDRPAPRFWTCTAMRFSVGPSADIELRLCSSHALAKWLTIDLDSRIVDRPSQLCHVLGIVVS